MNPTLVSDLVFEVTQEADGGDLAECPTENIVTHGDTWKELRTNVKEAVEGYFFGKHTETSVDASLPTFSADIGITVSSPDQ
jgi:predicted RNase H-like HicB family nuclease